MSVEDVSNSVYASHIEFRGPCQYRVRFRRKGYPKGSKTFESLVAAEEYCRGVESDLAHVGLSKVERKLEQHKAAQNITLHDLLAERKAALEKTKPDDATVYRLSQMMQSSIASISIHDLVPAHFEKYIEEREDDEVSGATIRRELNTFASTLTKAARRFPDVLRINPASAKQVEYPPDSEHRNRRLVGDEEQRLLKVCDDANRSPYLAAMVRIALETAMRQGEIRNLAWSEINFDQGYIYLPKTKTKRPRSVPLTSGVRNVLSEWRLYCEKRSKRLQIRMPDHVFFAGDGDGEVYPVTGNAIKIAFRRAREAASIEDLHFHDLRHEATSRLFERHGLSMVEVMSITGHRHSTMTERYTHLFAQEIGKKMGDKAAEIRLPLSEKELGYLREAGTRFDLDAEDVVMLLIRRAMREDAKLELDVAA